MFSKILYPTDFSDLAGKALAYVKQLREAGTREVVVVHIIDIREVNTVARAMALYGSKVQHDADRQIKEKIARDMDAIAAELKRSGLEVKTRVKTGVPFTEIVGIAEEENVSAIVLGSHGVSNVEEMLLGSVSEKVIRKSKVPVLVIKR
ncbi:MAG TPA: universal stress protein [Syntrophales bacterium]|nr:universal stress protein [Syntrophales bacterium]HOI17600.1 universal stress protein [Geobacteraceae bacterium]